MKIAKYLLPDSYFKKLYVSEASIRIHRSKTTDMKCKNIMNFSHWTQQHTLAL